MIGFAEIPAHVNGECKNTFAFTGNGQERVEYALKLPGPFSDDFDLHSDPGILSWSPCGGSTAILTMNTQCYINPTNQPALIAVSLLPHDDLEMK